MLAEWWWKKMWRPLLEHWGWIKPRIRTTYTAREWAEKLAEQDSQRARLG
jgi:hypothetical protein